jgi:hypothetical protein
MEGLEATAILGEDGAFVDNWRDGAFPGDENKTIREDPTLANIGDVRSMARQVVDSQSQIGKLSGGRAFAILPNEHSTPDEINEFHTKLGRPKTSTEYEYGKIPDANPKFVEKMETALHTAGVSKTAATAIAKAYGEFSAEDSASQVTEGKIADAQADKAIRTKFGSTYDAEMENAYSVIRAIAGPIDAEYALKMAEDVKYDLNAAQFLAAIGKKFAEDPGLKDATSATGFSPTDARAKANEVMRDNPYYLTETPKDKPRNKQAHDDAVQQVADLLVMANQ